ncbi:MAG: hypothetical protein ACK5CA_03470 [Cyanobacteriota bacterium]|jgi:rubredoxin
MLTYQCGQCGRRLRSSHKPKRCGDCGGERFRLIRDGEQSPSAAGPKMKPLPPLPPAPFLEGTPLLKPASKKPQKQRGSNLDSIWSLPDFSQIAGLSVILLIVGGAFGYGLYRVSGGPLFPKLPITAWLNAQKTVSVQGKDNLLEGAAPSLPPSGEPSSRSAQPQVPQATAPTPAQGTPLPGESSPQSAQPQVSKVAAPTQGPTLALRRYYQTLNQSNDGDRLDLAYRVEVYDEKVLRADGAAAAVKLGLRYHLKNGGTLCESRLFTLRRAPGQSDWQWERPLEIRPQPRCELR